MPTWVPDRVPIRGPVGARKEKNITKWNRAKYMCIGYPHFLALSHMQHSCPEGAIIYEVEPRNGYLIGYPYGYPIGVPIEAHEVWPII